MKKVIVTRDNYEEIMFDLLENQYERDVRENILDQIHADTFLSFEWQQWSKAVYSESTEIYKATEAEFLESLTKEEKKKKGLFYYLKPMAIAASILLIAGLYIVTKPSSDSSPHVAKVKIKSPDIKQALPLVIRPLPVKRKSPVPENNLKPSLPKDTLQTLISAKEELPPAPISAEQQMVLQRDTINFMLQMAQKQARYKVTITEGDFGSSDNNSSELKEKRYSMADVMNGKDGITLSKFLRNSSSRIVKDELSQQVLVEYRAEDHSVLVLVLSN